MWVVTVRFQIEARKRTEFEPLVLKNAAESLKEAGCVRFDVCFSEGSGECFLYEIYKDRMAFDAHLATPHFQEFTQSTQAVVLGKTVACYLLVST